MTDNFEKDINVPSKRKHKQSPIVCINANYLDLTMIWHINCEMGKFYANGVRITECSFEQYAEVKQLWFKFRSWNNDR